VRVFLAAVLGGYLGLVGATIAVGLIVTEVLPRLGGAASWDASVTREVAQARTDTLVDLSWVGSTLAGGVVIPAIVVTFVAVFLVLRCWRLAAFTLFVISLESGTYRVTTLAVHRDRPQLSRLETLPIEASFPSGHVAASVAFLAGLLLVWASGRSHRATKLALWSLALAIPIFVAWSRLLRGMHHITDVIAGMCMGLAALLVTIFACRAAGAASERKRATAPR
jgi:membrane-associated phospholipid phosphatase